MLVSDNGNIIIGYIVDFVILYFSGGVVSVMLYILFMLNWRNPNFDYNRIMKHCLIIFLSGFFSLFVFITIKYHEGNSKNG